MKRRGRLARSWSRSVAADVAARYARILQRILVLGVEGIESRSSLQVRDGFTTPAARPEELAQTEMRRRVIGVKRERIGQGALSRAPVFLNHQAAAQPNVRRRAARRRAGGVERGRVADARRNKN